MKKIEILIRPHTLEPVREALLGVGVQGITATEVKGFGRQRGRTETYRGSKVEVHFLPKLRLEVCIPDALLEPAVAAASLAARTGRIGDGKIMVSEVPEAVRVRTGEIGEAAL
jgi:nitrogen regulatory protein PII